MSFLPRFVVPDADAFRDARKHRKNTQYGHGYSRLPEIARSGRRYALFYVFAVLAVVYMVLVIRKRYFTKEMVWLPPFNHGPPVTLVFSPRDIRRIWQWEIESGHYPLEREQPNWPAFSDVMPNPARPLGSHPKEDFVGLPASGVGPGRIYVRPMADQRSMYPPRPPSGSVADMDIIMEHCDYATGKYGRDCLKFLRRGASLDNATRGVLWDCDQECRYLYVHDTNTQQHTNTNSHNSHIHRDFNLGIPPNVTKRFWSTYETLTELPPVQRPVYEPPCDPHDPNIFHMFWQGSFTDKPYATILSFLYTQNLGLHLHPDSPEYTSPSSPYSAQCRPQLWMWMYRAAWAEHDRNEWEGIMYEELRRNVWSNPFLHPRFQSVVKFRVFDASEQVNETPEFHDEWPASARHRYHRHRSDSAERPSNSTTHTNAPRSPKAVANYDLSIVSQSDLIRFLLCHRYGGTYLDVDIIFLRDFSDLFNANLAFAYRWSRLPRYNTAVLRMHKQSALGTFLLRTAFRNGMDFHPVRITAYMTEAGMDNLLMMMPVTLFDPGWLNAEGFERDRPPQPQFFSLEDFFKTPALTAGQPEALGFDGFFKGAYIYHYHNQWWLPFDPARNYPDLGPRFIPHEHERWEENEERSLPTDLPWSAVMKRTFEAYIRGEQPNMYGEWIRW